MSYFVGVDAGGSKCELCLIDEHQQTLASVHTVGINLHSLGADRAVALLLEALQQAPLLAYEGRIRGLYCGLAGYEPGSLQSQQFDQLLQSSCSFPCTTDNDTYPAWWSTTAGDAGLLVISGTGSHALAIDDQQRRFTQGGWGAWISDEGSGFAIGQQGLKKAIAALEGRASQTLLVQQLLAFIATQETVVKESVNLVAAVRYFSSVSRVAEFAASVSTCADAGDDVAVGILTEAANDLYELVEALWHRGQFDAQTVAVGAQGGCLQHMPILWQHLESRLAALSPRLQLVLPRYPAAVAAALLALQDATGVN